MKEKKFFYCLLFTYLLLIMPLKVGAIYNGGSDGISPGSGKCPTNSNLLCPYKNMTHLTVKVSLVYFNENGKREQIGKSVVYTNNNFRKITEFNTFAVTGCSSCKEGYNANGLKNYFYDNLDNFLELLNKTNGFNLDKINYTTKLNEFFVNYCSTRGKTTENCSQSSPGKYGFRILIEPYLTGLIKNNYYFMTIKEIASAGGMTNPSTFKDFSLLLHTTFDDVGISKANGATSNNGILSNPNTGYGYNIIDFAVEPDKIKKPCNPDVDGIKTCCDSESISFEDQNNNKYPNVTKPIPEDKLEEFCSNKKCNYNIEAKIPQICDGLNEGFIKDDASWDCAFYSTKSTKPEVKSHYTNNFSNSYCAVYCKEEVSIKLPSGNNVVQAGRYITIEEESIHGSLSVISPIKYGGKKTCRTTNGKSKTGGFIDYTKFEKDFNEIEDNILKAWNNYIILKNKANLAKEISDAKSNYDNLVKKRDQIIKDINACVISTISFNFSPNLKFEIKEPVYGGEWNLKKDTVTEKKVYYYKGGNSNEGTYSSILTNPEYKKQKKYVCNEKNGCVKSIEFNYPIVDWMEEKIEKNITYKLPDNLYTYIAKDSGKSYSNKSESSTQYISTTQSNIPIHFSTNPGDYEFRVVMDDLGAGNKFNNYIKNNTTFNGKVVYSEDLSYECSYNITCKDRIMNKDCEELSNACGGDYAYSCPGVNLIYRPISLFKGLAFLKENGDQRIPGNNWNKDDLVEKYIENARGQESYNIYDISPMFEIVLTPTLMKEIRKYNKVQNGKILTIYNETSAESTGVASYSDFESMTCNENGVECISNKIREWGISGCAISGFDNLKFSRCGTTTSW